MPEMIAVAPLASNGGSVTEMLKGFRERLNRGRRIDRDGEIARSVALMRAELEAVRGEMIALVPRLHSDAWDAQQLRHQHIVELINNLHNDAWAASASRHFHVVQAIDSLLVRSGEGERRLTDLDRRAAAIQGLAGRTFERILHWSERLEQLRSSTDYDAAFDEARPLITVVVSTWNKAGLLCDRALASVRSQTYDNWEVVVVGDACTDDTEQRIASLGDPRIRFENLQVRGPYPNDPVQMWFVQGTRAVRRGFELARGQWISQLDDDDEWDHDHLEVLLDEVRRTRAELVYGKWRLGDAASKELVGVELGSWPPRHGGISFQCAIEHAILRHLPPDPFSYLQDESHDWQRARRMIDAGVRFAFLDRPVTTIWFTPKSLEQHQWFAVVAGSSTSKSAPDPSAH